MSERQVEIPWAVEHAEPPTLDVGSAESTYLAHLEEPVDGIDCRPSNSTHLRNSFIGDIREFAFSAPYQTVLAISTLEHVGLAHGPYGTEEDDAAHGDQEAVKGCWAAVAPGGKLLISVPFGAQRNYGWFRQYDLDGLVRLMGQLLFMTEVWVRADNDEWWEVHNLDEMEEVEKLEYDFEKGSARAVALITVPKSET